MALPFGRTVAEVVIAELLAQNIPVESVSIGNNADRSTWVFALKASATTAERAAAEVIRTTFDYTAAAAETTDRTRRRDQTLWTPQMVALVRALNARLRAANVDQVTVGAFRTSIEVEYDALVS